MSNFFWNSDPTPPVGPPVQPPGAGGGPGGSRWFSGPPYRIGGQYGVPPPFQGTQDWLNGVANGSGTGPMGAGAGWGVGVPHTPLTQVPRVAPNGGAGGATNLGGGGPVGPPTQMPPWWQAFQQYAGQRFPWLNNLGAGARNWFGPPGSPNPSFGGGPTGTGTPGPGGYTYPRGIY